MDRARAYVDADGNKPFEQWFGGLDKRMSAKAKVRTAIRRLELGNISNVASVGGGVFEIKIHFGPGYRVYFAWLDGELILLLGGGIKKRQSADIATAKERWTDYKQRSK